MFIGIIVLLGKKYSERALCNKICDTMIYWLFFIKVWWRIWYHIVIISQETNWAYCQLTQDISFVVFAFYLFQIFKSTLFLEGPVVSLNMSWYGYYLSVDNELKHDDVIKWKHFPPYWPFVRGIHRSPVNSPHKGQWRGALMCSLICAWPNGWVNNGEAGDLRRHRAHYDVTVMEAHYLYFVF